MPPTPQELHRRAVDLSNRRRFAAARRLLRLAAAAADEQDVDLRASIAGTEAFVAGQLGDPVAAEQLCRETLARKGLSEQTRARIAGQLGALMTYAGRVDEAIHWLGEAIDHLPDDDPVAAANLRMNRSMVRMQTGELRESRADLELAKDAFERGGTVDGAAQAEHNLGYLAMLEGELVEALNRMSTARTALAEDAGATIAICDADRAEVLREAGLTTEAERLLTEAARVFGAHRMTPSRAVTELQLAISLLRHDALRAYNVAASARRRFAALKSDSWAARAEAVRMRAALTADLTGGSGDQRRVRRGIPQPGEIASLARELTRAGLRNDAVALRLTHCLWRARRGESGIRLPALPERATLEVRLLAHEVRAARAAARGHDAQARHHAGVGLADLAAWRASFGSFDMQASLAMHGNGLMLTGLDAAVRSGRPDIVFEWSEHARHLSQQVTAVRPPIDAGAAADLAELRVLRAELTESDWTADSRVRALGDRLRHRQWTSSGAGEVAQVLALTDAAAALDADTALLSYVFSPAGLHVVLVTVNDARMIALAGWERVRAALPGLRADLDMSATVQTGPMAEVIRRSLRTRLAALSADLVDPALKGVAARRLVITVPGVLSGMPWAMLPGMRGRAFTLAPSVSHWVRGGVGGGVALGSIRAGFAVGPRVARAGEEVRAAAAVWNGAHILSGIDASVAAVTAAAGGVDVLHIAAHGRHSVDNPLFSGLELADGTLFGYDIDLIPHVPDTIILSACEVGRSAVRWGEEAVGMTRAWMHAGARSIIAAPVVVADDDACELLAVVHEGLAAGDAPAQALADAAERTGIVAPFQCYGSGV